MEHDDIHQLVLTPLGARSWRLCDRAVSRTEAASVVAYVELLDDGAYEAVWVSVGLGSARFPALADLFHAAVAKLEQSRSRGALKPAPIPHRRPAVA